MHDGRGRAQDVGLVFELLHLVQIDAIRLGRRCRRLAHEVAEQQLDRRNIPSLRQLDQLGRDPVELLLTDTLDQLAAKPGNLPREGIPGPPAIARRESPIAMAILAGGGVRLPLPLMGRGWPKAG